METLSLSPSMRPLGDVSLNTSCANNANNANANNTNNTNKPTLPSTNANDTPENEEPESPESPESPTATMTNGSTKKRALSPSAALSGGHGFASVPLEGTRLRAPSADDVHIDPQDLTLLKVIGRGTFAQQVALARLGLGASQRLVVVKSLDKQRLIARQQVAHTLTEKRVLEMLGGAHPFIVQLVAAFQTPTDLHFVLEYCQGGELFFHLQQQQQQKFSERATQFYAAEVLSALHELHAHGIVYRDLKPENVLLDAQGHVKLADFGFAKQDMADGKRTFSFCGSPEYLSPEMVHKRGHGVETDMWSFGCFVYELLTGAPPFQHSNLRRLFTLIEEGRVWYPPFLSGAAVSLLQGLLRVNPKSRLTAQEAMKHAFFSGLDWDELLQRHVPPPLVPTCANGECTQNFDDGFTSEPVKSLCGKNQGTDWSKRPRQDSADVFCGF